MPTITNIKIHYTISETFFPANFLASTKDIKLKLHKKSSNTNIA